MSLIVPVFNAQTFEKIKKRNKNKDKVKTQTKTPDLYNPEGTVLYIYLLHFLLFYLILLLFMTWFYKAINLINDKFEGKEKALAWTHLERRKSC